MRLCFLVAELAQLFAYIVMANTTCTSPEDGIANGYIHTQGPYNAGQTAVFECKSGFEMTGNSILTCGNDLKWDASFPNCTSPAVNAVNNTYTTSADIPLWALIAMIILAVIVIVFLVTLICMVYCHNRQNQVRTIHLEQHGRSQDNCYNSERHCNTHCFAHNRYSRCQCDENCLCTCDHCQGNKYSNEKPRPPSNDEYETEKQSPATPTRVVISQNSTSNVQLQKVTKAVQHQSTPRLIRVTNEVMEENDKNKKPAKDLKGTWMPHSNPVRSINTSTK